MINILHYKKTDEPIKPAPEPEEIRGLVPYRAEQFDMVEFENRVNVHTFRDIAETCGYIADMRYDLFIIDVSTSDERKTHDNYHTGRVLADISKLINPEVPVVGAHPFIDGVIMRGFFNADLHIKGPLNDAGINCLIKMYLGVPREGLKNK
jgi:hypothetical protein